MPYKSEKIPIAGTELDLRVKLSPEKKEAIRILKSAGFSYRKLAEMFRCSKWTVQSIIHPPQRPPQPTRGTEYHTAKTREYRRRKQKLFVEGKLNCKNKLKK